MADAAEAARQYQAAAAHRRWILKAPALLTILLASVGPLAVMLIYSVMEKGNYGGVALGHFSAEGWTAVFVEHDPFDEKRHWPSPT